MEIELESTTKTLLLTVNGARVPARLWEGKTKSGIPVYAFVTRIAVAKGADQAEFERELLECRAPSPEAEAIPARLVL